MDPQDQPERRVPQAVQDPQGSLETVDPLETLEP